MKILRIGGRNLASLAEEFCVDFEAAPLAASGLFAISGPTGAGKSTLLDALCLALYGATPRLKTSRTAALVPDVGSDTVSAQDPRSLLRRGAAEGHAEVDFVGNDGQRYRARWSVRRARSRASGALQNAAMSLQRLPDGAPIGATRTEVAQEIGARIGLSFDQFTRAVLLAQNEFSAFLKTDENERGELLETLTGSVIYSAISKRAFERYRREQDQLRLMSAQLAGQAPLDETARAALDADSAAADAVLAALEQRQAGLDQLERWRQLDAGLREGVVAAEQALHQAAQTVADAAPRRQHLALLEAVEEARSLLAERSRLNHEQATQQAAISAGEQDALRLAALETQAGVAVAAAGTALAQAQQASQAAAPLLDQAKALDAALAALAPAYAQAVVARDAAAADASAASQAVQADAAAIALAQQRHGEGAAWLAEQRALAPLAQQWPRWDRLLEQGALLQGRMRELEQRRQGAEQQAVIAAEQAAASAGAAASAAQALQAAQQAREQAAATLARFDGVALRRERQAVSERREQLLEARTLRRELAQQEERAAAAGGQLAQAEAQFAAADDALAQARAEAPALDAAAREASAALRGAELAASANVESLRSQLQDDAPCPVCGAVDHPYRDATPALHALLDQLRQQVEETKAAASANLAGQASESARLDGAQQRSAALKVEGAALAASLEQLRQRWQSMPVGAELQDHAAPLDWFDASVKQLSERLREVDAAELAARQAQAARDGAQAEVDQAAAAHARAVEAAAAARLTASTAQAALGGWQDKAAQAGEALLTILDELAEALDDGAQDWRSAWQNDPQRFRARRAELAARYNQEALAQPERLAAWQQLQARHAASVAASAQADKLASQVQADFARIDADMAARRNQRAPLFDGASVAAVETKLAAAIDAARSAMALREQEAQDARLALARARDGVQAARIRSDALSTQLAEADHAIASWLAGFAGRHPGLETPYDASALAALLAVPAAERQAEQTALAAVERALAAAQTVLSERRLRSADHGAQSPAGNLETLAADLAALAIERKDAADHAGALRLQVAQDEARRASAAAALAGIERQQAIERRWGKLSELIGSADGKKFRNYAQQFTLDVLLGYANAHLAELAKRYRLERVGGGAGPSLGLMVRDQDMGGEVRGVNSLSGGESFLVSLALALGLASLSSNRVKVESLFIDEGFGSLDSETLRVAMDALDGLQAMGRKVGVISHVQEMTERIATRIVVQPSGGGSSTVSVE